MLPVVKERKPDHVFRLGHQVPEDAVNLAYTHVPSLSPADNLTIVDLSRFIPENTGKTETEILMWPDETHLLRDQAVGGRAEIPSRTFLVTNVFSRKTGEPLFFKHELRYPIYDPKGPDDFGYYNGSSVVVTDADGKPLPSHLQYQVILVRSELGPDLWRVLVYTSFQTNGIDSYRVKYAAIEVRNGQRFPRIGETEILNPQPAFELRELDEVVGGTDPNNPYYHRTNAPELAWSRVYVPRTRIPDTRRPVPFNYEIRADGVVVKTGQAAVLHPTSVLPDEPNYLRNSLVLVPDVRSLYPAATENTVFTITADRPDVRVTCRPDGRGPALATTTTNTDPIGPDGKTRKLQVPVKYERITVNGLNYFTPTYALRLLDQRQIKVMKPLETGPIEPWYLRIQNGRFERVNGETHGYFLPEYYRQHYDPEMPYRKVQWERPEIVGERKVRLRYTPLYVTLSADKEPENLTVLVNPPDNFRQLSPDELKPYLMPVRRWNVVEGTLELAGAVQETDRIYVTYHYDEGCYTYRGFWDEERGRFWHLDLNPGPGHLVTMIDHDGEVKDLPSYRLINETVYIYLRPAAQIDENKQIIPGTFRRDTLFHTFRELSEAEMQAQRAVLLAKILVRPNAVTETLQIVDTRVRGGGLKEEITKALMQELEPESQHYWDIGYWDGEPFMENAVLVVRLPKQILQEYGGRHTRQEVEEIIQRHVAWGVLVIIEYVEDDIIVQRPDNLVVDTIEVELPRPIPPLGKPGLRAYVANVAP